MTFKPGRDYTTREGVEVIWADKTKKDFSVALEQGFVGSKKNTKAKYLSGAEDKFKGAGQGEDEVLRRPAHRQLLQGRGHREEEQSREYRSGEIQDRVFAAADQGARVPDAAPRGDRTIRFYLITHKRMYRNQSAFTANNAILNQALGPDAATNYVTDQRRDGEAARHQDGRQGRDRDRVGKVDGIAQVVQGIRPDTIAVSYHYGTFSPGLSPAARNGTWINQVLEHHPDLISGHNSFNDTKCKLYRA